MLIRVLPEEPFFYAPFHGFTRLALRFIICSPLPAPSPEQSPERVGVRLKRFEVRNFKAHDEYPRGLFIVVRCKVPSFQNGYMERFEIPRGHLGVVHLQRFMGVWHIPF